MKYTILILLLATAGLCSCTNSSNKKRANIKAILNKTVQQQSLSLNWGTLLQFNKEDSLLVIEMFSTYPADSTTEKARRLAHANENQIREIAGDDAISACNGDLYFGLDMQKDLHIRGNPNGFSIIPTNHYLIKNVNVEVIHNKISGSYGIVGIYPNGETTIYMNIALIKEVYDLLEPIVKTGISIERFFWAILMQELSHATLRTNEAQGEIPSLVIGKDLYVALRYRDLPGNEVQESYKAMTALYKRAAKEARGSEIPIILHDSLLLQAQQDCMEDYECFSQAINKIQVEFLKDELAKYPNILEEVREKYISEF